MCSPRGDVVVANLGSGAAPARITLAGRSDHRQGVGWPVTPASVNGVTVLQRSLPLRRGPDKTQPIQWVRLVSVSKARQWVQKCALA
ncbi:hypothetical protein GCM10010977_07830 [Citricoccus zhacaiensis]|uniref:Uncharacterized protein n=1 Tax=Citricoccus zhacaiensis TaxID=489142 RepID=A0ABQ2LRK4_9MICC|nr:hypothetical protein GCM10010977_07830 [Citricoccus zhacaiensis]